MMHRANLTHYPPTPLPFWGAMLGVQDDVHELRQQVRSDPARTMHSPNMSKHPTDTDHTPRHPTRTCDHVP
jgi:hypothetical protein